MTAPETLEAPAAPELGDELIHVTCCIRNVSMCGGFIDVIDNTLPDPDCVVCVELAGTPGFCPLGTKCAFDP